MINRSFQHCIPIFKIKQNIEKEAFMICKRIFQAIMSVIPLAKAVENK
ncbi:hypothetical protein HMPREF1866_01989 [Lachnoanaerobaculum saburreum]|uniref:Uncharacterized protein n=2 Tax=Bacillota TaxID=1239 RepID=F9P9C8_STRCV|nr:hypothetical protein HMPREF1042_0053 [Streptococcus constellatus subsp. pharyngis SK1060 = CCUG 46377]ERJ81263.1 hypothetical protein HMPREF1987_01796 [Peptostreptococcaceae bacterium oral taxon 113 str. W5053]KXB55767.1 hypothetical protein HMPREF1866_01989 [Lachnoanaerobaculum saburreum]